MKRYRLAPGGAVVAGIVVTVAANAAFWNRTHSVGQAAVLAVCPGAAFAVMLLLGSDRGLERLQEWIDRWPPRLIAAPAALWLLYVIYSVGAGIAAIEATVTMAAYLGLPFLALWLPRKAPTRLWLEPLVIIWIWFPLEFGIIRRILITGTPDLHYAFAQLLAIDAGVIAFAVWNRTPHIGYRFEWDLGILVNGTANFLVFAAIAIPLGLVIHFLRYSFSLSKLYPAPLAFAGIFLFTALPEEFLFRGLIQNWIQRVAANKSISLIAGAVIFGASHLNNGPPIPNYRYFLMASIAGVFYGRAWRNTGSLMASSLTHALVDTFWSLFFR